MSVSFSLFPSPRGVELHKRRTTDDLLIPGRMFPSPRGVELHKLGEVWSHSWDPEVEFPSPRGVELHKLKKSRVWPRIHSVFPSPRGVELHKLVLTACVSLGLLSIVSVPSRG